MKTEPTIFSFESSTQIRMVSVDTRPYFIAQDVCAALGIKAVDVALRKLDSDEKGTYSVRTHGGYQSQSVISESGLYTLILRCRDAVTPEPSPTASVNGSPARCCRQFVRPGSTFRSNSRIRWATLRNWWKHNVSA